MLSIFALPTSSVGFLVLVLVLRLVFLCSQDGHHSYSPHTSSTSRNEALSSPIFFIF